MKLKAKCNIENYGVEVKKGDTYEVNSVYTLSTGQTVMSLSTIGSMNSIVLVELLPFFEELS